MNDKLKSRKVMGIPDPLASEADKKDPSYGLKWANAIQQEWFGGGMITNKCLFSQKHQEIDELRRFVRGEYDLDSDKQHISRQPEDLTLHNLDFTPINYAEKFVNKVVNGISKDYYRIDVRSIDRFSSLEKKKKYDRHKTNMAANPMLEKAAALGLPDLTEKGYVPQDEEELRLYTQIKERPMQEISEEILIDFAKKTNGWDQTKKKTDKDLAVCDMQVARIYTDENNGVVPEYVDAGTFVHSFAELEDYKDAFYFGQVDTITINELRRESGYDETTCRRIAKLYAGQNKINELAFNFSHAPMENILDIKVHILRFTFESDKKIVWKRYMDKKNRTKKVALRDDSYQVPEGAEKSRLVRRLDTWYEGNYVIGSNQYIYNYQESEILAKDEMDKVLPPFVVQSTNLYRNRLRSFLKNIVPLCKTLQRIHLKIQHLVAELKPDLIEIDIDQIANLVGDAKGNPEENIKKTLSYLSVKGVVIKKRVNMGEDGMKDGSASRPVPQQQGSALGVLLNSWNFYYKQIQDITGLDPVQAQSLVGTNQMIQLSNNTATKHLVDASVMFDKRVCETISARVKGIFKFERLKHLRKILSDAVGRENIDALEGVENRSLHEFGFTVEMIPAKEELDELRQDLGIALNEGTIDVSDKSEIMAIARNNMKQARQYMHFVRARNIKQRMKETEFNNKTQAKNNMQSAQAKQQGELIVYQKKKQIDLQYKAQESAITLKEHAQKQQIDQPLRQEKFQQDVYLEQVKSMALLQRDEMKENAKDDRVDKQSTQQSKLIEQRQDEMGPFDFTKPDIDLNDLLGVPA
jgi:hypothetical protein